VFKTVIASRKKKKQGATPSLLLDGLSCPRQIREKDSEITMLRKGKPKKKHGPSKRANPRKTFALFFVGKRERGVNIARMDHRLKGGERGRTNLVLRQKGSPKKGQVNAKFMNKRGGGQEANRPWKGNPREGNSERSP